jgi:hypothetical protein
MPKKAEDFRIQGVSFEQAVKRIATTPPQKAIPNPKAIKPKRKK